jgi:hypothetical protein
MDASIFYVLQIISSFSVLLPILLGLIVFKSRDFIIRIFLIFLVIGFVTDLAGWYFYLTQNWQTNVQVQHVYILLESVFLLWFVSNFIGHKTFKAIVSKLWIVAIPLWALALFMGKDAITIFKVTSQVIVASLSSFCLLKFIEKSEAVIKQITFWLLIGVFFYNFCTFFFMSLLASQTGWNLWYIHNITNILTNLIYAAGFLQCRRSVSLVH